MIRKVHISDSSHAASSGKFKSKKDYTYVPEFILNEKDKSTDDKLRDFAPIEIEVASHSMFLFESDWLFEGLDNAPIGASSSPEG